MFFSLSNSRCNDPDSMDGCSSCRYEKRIVLGFIRNGQLDHLMMMKYAARQIFVYEKTSARSVQRAEVWFVQ